jgi:Holliday junction resolvase RusA-like endonuclease
MNTTIRFFVAGKPQPRGSKRAFPYKKHDGKLGVKVSDDNPKGKYWMASVAYEAAARFGGNGSMFTGPIVLRLTFVMPRPKGHYGTGKNRDTLKPSAPTYHTSRPDALKLTRAVEDAMQGICFLDDAQICQESIEKVYGEKPGVTIEIVELEPLPPATG